MVPTLILPPRDTADAQAISIAASNAGWQVVRLATWRAPATLQGRELVLYGEPLFIDVITPALGLAVLEASWDWTATLPEEYRRRNIRFTILSEATSQSTRAFVKPTEDKCFAARLYSSGSALAAASAALPGSTPVLVAEPVTWDIEFRCFVLNRRVMTYAPYLRDGEPLQEETRTWPSSAAESEEALTYANALLADSRVVLPAAIVVDVGKIRGRGWAVVETNGAWGAGIYGCDPAGVLPVLARATRPLDALCAEDAGWIRKQYIVE
jgi:hypothetical protein